MIGRATFWAIAAALALPVWSQSPTGNPDVPASFRAPSPAAQPAAQEVVREIDDPHSGDVWLLTRNSEHAGGPGRLVLAQQQSSSRSRTIRDRKPTAENLPVIRAGDALVVEEHSPVVDARLDAVALEPAAKGGALKARLRIGGNVVRVVAIAHGSAMLAEKNEGSR